ncbi:MAG: hypothetical protein R3236_05745, partial [Phycisphaeraceae bacterium]|nr:hypothetical protein [Phycisphaeraceae bacterium]
WKLIEKEAPEPRGPVPVEITVKPSSLNPDTGLEQALLDVVVRSSNLKLASTGPLDKTALKDLHVAATFDGANHRLDVDLSAEATVASLGEPGPVKLIAQIDHPLSWGAKDPKQASRFAAEFKTLKIEKLPRSFLRLLGVPKVVAASLGPTLNAEGGGRLLGREPLRGELDLSLQSGRAKADVALVMDARSIHQKKPTVLSFPLSPEAFEALAYSEPQEKQKGQEKEGDGSDRLPTRRIRLVKTTEARLRIETLNLPPLGDPDSFDLSSVKISAALNLPEARFIAVGSAGENESESDTEPNELLITGAALTAEGAGQGEPLRLKLSGRLGYAARSDAKPPPGSFEATASIGGLLFSRNVPSPPMVAFKINTTRVPVQALDDFLGYDGVVVSAAGAGADLQMDGKLKRTLPPGAEGAGPLGLFEGPVRCRLKADHARTEELRGRLRGGRLDLLEPIVLYLDVTEPLGRGVLSRVHPMFQTLQPGEKPIVLTIPNQGLQIPVTGFAIEKMVVPEATLQLGKLSFKKKGFWHALLSLLIASGFGADAIAGDELRAWFTPMKISIRDGKLVYDRRLDVLISDTIEMSTWGTINLAKGKLALTLSINNRTLQKILKNVGLGVDFRIPITAEWKSDITRATGSLASLVAQDNLVSAADGLTRKLAAQVLGGMIQRILGGGGAKPPASVDPLPWDKKKAP